MSRCFHRREWSPWQLKDMKRAFGHDWPTLVDIAKRRTETLVHDGSYATPQTWITSAYIQGFYDCIDAQARAALPTLEGIA